MTTRLPLPPLPDLTPLAAHPAFAAATARLHNRRNTGRMYEDSPYIAAAHDPEPDEKDDGPWCRARRP